MAAAMIIWAGGNISPVVNTMEGLRSSLINGKLSAFSSIATMFAGIFCALVLLKISHDYLEGRGITLWQVLRPLVIFACVTNFSTFVLTPIHSFTQMASRSMGRQAEFSAKAFTAAVRKSIQVQYYKSLQKTASELGEVFDNGKTENPSVGMGPQPPAEKPSFWKRIGEGVGNFFKGAVNFVGWGLKATGRQIDFALSSTILLAIESILVLVMKAFMIGQQIYCYVYLIILGVLGPFAFALAILPSYSHNISSWIARYISIALWIPIGQLMYFLNYQILLHMADMSKGYDFGDKWIMIITLAICILNIKAVPQIASYVIESAGDGGAKDRGKGTIRETVQTVGSVAALL